MRARVLLLSVVAAVTLAACFPSGGPGGRARIVQDHKHERKSRGIAKLASDFNADLNASYSADRLRDRNGRRGCTLSHTSSSQMAGWYAGQAWAENIACVPGCGSAGAVTPLFMSSASHAANILNPGYHRMGLGVACNATHLFVSVHLIS